jgi:filamentous hemagglutinin
VVTFDGIDGNVLIDRKVSVTTRSKQLRDLQRISEAAKQNPGYKVRIEVPNDVEARRVRRILLEQGINNIGVGLPKK